MPNREDAASGNWRWAALACIVLFGVLRLASSLDNFYIDEIWSFFFARQMTSVADAFRLNHDNNHIINTVYLYLIGKEPFFLSGQPTFIPHRLLSVITGTISLWLIWKIALKKGRVEAFTAIILAGLSYPLIIYSSEARGYGPGMMFALASFLAALEYLSGKGILTAVLFWLAAVLAFLSHSSFIFVYVAILAWSVLEGARRSPIPEAAKRLALLHLFPLAFLAVYYLMFLKGMVYGGGETGQPWKEVLLTASMAMGLASGGFAGYASLAAVLILSAAGLLAVKKDGDGEHVFYILAIFIVPALIISIMKPEFLYFRYFLVCFPFFYLLASRSLSGLYRKSPWGKAGFFAAIALFGVFNIWKTAGLIRDGRGAYSEAVEFMAKSTPGQEVRVGSDHDFRNGLVLGFYSGFFREKRIVYLDSEARKEAVPDWLIRHSVDKGYKPPAYLFDSGERFTLEQSYGFAGVSGWSWFLYGRDVER